MDTYKDIHLDNKIFIEINLLITYNRYRSKGFKSYYEIERSTPQRKYVDELGTTCVMPLIFKI